MNGYDEYFYHFKLVDIIIQALSSKRLENHFDFSVKFDGVNFNELNTGELWKKIQIKLGDSTIFPIILYMDGASLCHFSNVSSHPIWIFFGALPISERFKKENRFLYGYLPEGVPLTAIMEIFGNSFYFIIFLCYNK